MRIICLDIGTKRIGVAATDPLALTAQGIGVIRRHGGKRDMTAIENLCRELEADMMVIGLPLGEEGDVGPAAAKTQSFAKRLGEYLRDAGLDFPIEMWDERYSTAIAEERLIDANVSRAKRKRVIDKMAALVILEDWLAANDVSSLEGENVKG